MRVGVTIPQFRADAETALRAARRADALGLDGVFVFDHLWPLGRPDRPALHSTTLLGALVTETEHAVLGTLVARVGLVADAVLVHTLVSLARMAGPERFIAGLGTGDRANRAENVAYGIPFAPAAERLASVVDCAGRLREAGVHTWIGGDSPAILAAVVDARPTGWNGWQLPVDAFAARAAQLRETIPAVEPTWAGQVLVGRTPEEAAAKRDRFGDRPGVVTGTVDDLAAHLRGLTAAGATWAVCAPLDAADEAAYEPIAAAACVA